MDVRSKILLQKPENLPLSLSVSKAKTFKDCKAKFYFGYIEKLPQKEYDFHIFGKFLHKILENYYQKILDGCTDSPNVILTASWKEAFSEWKSKLTKDQVTEAKQICTIFLQNLAKETEGPTILEVEKQFYIDINGQVLLNGYIDRVQIDSDGVLHVSDYKTSKDKKYLKKDFFQLLTYAFVMYLEDPSLKKIRTSYIMLKHNFDPIIKEFSVEEIKSIENVFLDYAEKIHNEKLFRPSPTPLCKYCSFLDVCDAGQRFTGIQNMKFGADKW